MIETQIQELIAALDRNTQALTAFLTPNLPPPKRQSAMPPSAEEQAEAVAKSEMAKPEVVEAPKPKKAKKEAEQPVVGEATVTLETLRELGDKLQRAGKQPAIYNLVRKYGAENLRTLDAKNYVPLHKEMLAELLRTDASDTSIAPPAPVAPVKTETARVEAPKPAEVKPEAKPEPEVTLEALKTYALSLVEQGCAQAIGQLAQKYGKKRLSEIPESAYVEAFAALKDIEAGLQKAA